MERTHQNHPVQLLALSRTKYSSAGPNPGFHWRTPLYPSCFLFSSSWLCCDTPMCGCSCWVPLGSALGSLGCPPKGEHQEKPSWTLGSPICTCRTPKPGSKQNQGRGDGAAAPFPLLSEWKQLLKQKGELFYIKMQKSTFKIQNQKHSPALYLQSPAFVTCHSQVKPVESWAFLPVSPHSICQVLIFFSFYQQSLKLIISI